MESPILIFFGAAGAVVAAAKSRDIVVMPAEDVVETAVELEEHPLRLPAVAFEQRFCLQEHFQQQFLQ